MFIRDLKLNVLRFNKVSMENIKLLNTLQTWPENYTNYLSLDFAPIYYYYVLLC